MRPIAAGARAGDVAEVVARFLSLQFLGGKRVTGLRGVVIIKRQLNKNFFFIVCILRY